MYHPETIYQKVEGERPLDAGIEMTALPVN